MVGECSPAPAGQEGLGLRGRSSPRATAAGAAQGRRGPRTCGRAGWAPPGSKVRRHRGAPLAPCPAQGLPAAAVVQRQARRWAPARAAHGSLAQRGAKADPPPRPPHSAAGSAGADRGRPAGSQPAALPGSPARTEPRVPRGSAAPGSPAGLAATWPPRAGSGLAAAAARGPFERRRGCQAPGARLTSWPGPRSPVGPRPAPRAAPPSPRHGPAGTAPRPSRRPGPRLLAAIATVLRAPSPAAAPGRRSASPAPRPHLEQVERVGAARGAARRDPAEVPPRHALLRHRRRSAPPTRAAPPRPAPRAPPRAAPPAPAAPGPERGAPPGPRQ